MSRNGVDGFSRRRSASLKERLFVSRTRKQNQSTRARIQSTGALKDSDANVRSPLNNKYKILREMSIRIYTLDNVSRNAWERLKNNTRFPWSWDAYTIVLGEKEMYSTSSTGMFVKPIRYSSIETWSAIIISHLPFSYIKMCTSDSSCLIQAPDTYQRDRLLYSVQWKINVTKYEKVLYSSSETKSLVKELQSLVRLTLEGPLYLDDINHTLLEIVSNLLSQNQHVLKAVSIEALISTLAPLFEENQPSFDVCNFFIKHCRTCPRSRIVIDMFMPIVMRILKYNINYGKNVWLRSFVKEYILALSVQNDGEAATRSFVQTVHGPLSVCPHKRILNNLFPVCLSAIYDSFTSLSEKKNHIENKTPISSSCNEKQDPGLGKTNLESTKNKLWEAQKAKYTSNNDHNIYMVSTDAKSKLMKSDVNTSEVKSPERGDKVLAANYDHTSDPETALVFVNVLDEISTISDWLTGLAVLFQPVPFQTEAMLNKEFMERVSCILERIISSGNDSAIWCLISLREHKDGWLQICSPQSNVCHDNGNLFSKMVAALLDSAKKLHKVKKIINVLVKTCMNAVLLLALRENETMIEVLCYALEYKLTSCSEDTQITSTLKSTTMGCCRYEELCEQEAVLMQQGGPEAFTLPPRSTDQDLQQFLCSGACGNLRDLNLSLTYVSCKSADLISRLPLLQHLNLWSSHIRDPGLRRLCERLNLTSLNLCETHVTDEGIICLRDMTKLTDLNLNSTGVTEEVYRELRQNLPNLVHCDVTYTEADCYHATADEADSQNNTLTTSPALAKKLEYNQNI